MYENNGHVKQNNAVFNFFKRNIADNMTESKLVLPKLLLCDPNYYVTPISKWLYK